MKALLKGLLLCVWTMTGFLSIFGIVAMVRGQFSPFAAVVVLLVLPLSCITYKARFWLQLDLTPRLRRYESRRSRNDSGSDL